MVYNYIWLFFIYAIFGWCMEVVVSLIYRHKFVNRGFLIGPYCPIYGVGVLFITIFLSRYKEDLAVFFIMTMVACAFLEYLTSYLMEKIFHARWWDYSDKKFNLNGRICLDTMLPFGLMGVGVTYLCNPILMKFILSIPYNIRGIIAIVLSFIFIVDLMISLEVMSNLKKIKFAKKDNTEEITKKVKKALEEKNFFTKRLVEAFPNFELLRKKTKETIEKTKDEIKQKQKEIIQLKRKLNKSEKTLKKLNKKRGK